MRNMKRRLQLLRDESGIALVTALGTLFVLSIITATVIDVAATNSRSAHYASSDQRAVSTAEAGFNNAAAVLMSAVDPGAANALPAGSADYGQQGTVSWSGTKSGNVWTITATSTVANPTGGAPLQHTVSGQVVATSPSTAVGAWDYIYSDTTTSCLLMQNSFTINAPLYVRGNLCMSNSASFAGPLLDVRGRIETFNSASVGTAASPVAQVRVSGGCRFGGSGAFVSPCTPAQRVWATTFAANPPTIAKPPIDLSYWYENAKPGPRQYCTQGSFPGGASKFENNSTPLDKSAGAADLLPSTNYDCIVRDGTGAIVGRIAWTNGSPGTLTIHGVIYFDGEIVISGHNDAVYTGQGVVYATDKIKISNNTRICGVANCVAANWDPNTSLLLLVSGSSSSPAFEVENHVTFQGAGYAVGGFKVHNNSTWQGPAIANNVDASNSALVNTWVPLAALLPGMPADATLTTPATADYVAHSWRG
jgi:hypothetical protein